MKRFSSVLLGALMIFIAFWIVGCAGTQDILIQSGLATPEKVYVTEKVLKGKASYYYGRWIGRKTANGEIYRAGDITAAHKTLPFNTMVRVTNLNNGKQVILRINNRGPYIRGRIIDLSLEAAKKVEMTKAGVVPVQVDVLREVPVLRQPNLRGTPVVHAAASPTPTPPTASEADAMQSSPRVVLRRRN